MARIILLSLSLLAFGSVLSAEQDAPQSSTKDDPRFPVPNNVALSATGGTSKGSYQAGVDWTIVEFLRRSRDSSFRTKLRPSLEMIGSEAPNLAVASGVSAGNIDAFLAALSWCTAKPSEGQAPEIAAEQSLFWTVWIGTSLQSLLRVPPKDEDEFAIFDRSRFMGPARDAAEVPLSDVIRIATQNAKAVKGCKVSLGIALTRQTPVEVKFPGFEGLRVPVSRFGSVVEVAEQDGKLHIGRLEAASKNGLAALGALALPRVGGTACKDQKTTFDWMFNVVMASSSFPVAFAARPVCYEHGGLDLYGAAGGQQAVGRFVDGGVFDNEPIDLAIGLFELRRSEELSKAGLKNEPATQKNLRVFGTSGGHVLRGAIEDRARLREENDDVAHLLGLTGNKQMVVGALSAARQYELHSLARQRNRTEFLDRDSPPRVDPSTRGAGIVGEMVGGFAGFFGQPFREYDFYSGIYDGFFLLAKTYSDQPTRTVLQKLIQQNVFKLSEAARQVVAWRFQDEFGEPVDIGKSIINPRIDTLLAIHEALVATVPLDPSRPLIPCTGSGLVGSVLCSGNFKGFLKKFTERRAALKEKRRSDLEKELRERDSDREQCAVVEKGTPYPACFEDDDFRELMKDPEAAVNDWIVRSLDRLADAEERLGERYRQAQWGANIKGYLLLYRGTDFKYRPKGFQRKAISFNPSSAIQDGRYWFPMSAALLAPNFFGEFGEGRMIGWRPIAFHPIRPVMISTNLTWVRHRCSSLAGSRSECDEGEDKKNAWYKGASVTLFLPKWTLPGNIGTLLPRSVDFRWENGLKDRSVGSAWSVSGRFFAGKVFVDWRRQTPRGLVPGENGTRFNELRVGVSDLNGLLYWFLR